MMCLGQSGPAVARFSYSAPRTNGSLRRCSLQPKTTRFRWGAGSLGAAPLKTLLIAKAAVEGLAGLLVMLFPAQAVSLLVGTPPEGPVGNALARIAAAALLALGIACWLAREDSKSPTAAGLILGLILYDATLLVSLLYVDLVVRSAGLLLWPAVSLHLVLGAWSILCLGKGLRRPVLG